MYELINHSLGIAMRSSVNYSEYSLVNLNFWIDFYNT